MKSRCQLSHMPPETYRVDPFIVTSRFHCLLAIRHSLACRYITPSSASHHMAVFPQVSSHHLSSVFYSLYLFFCHLPTPCSPQHPVQMQWEFKSSSLSHPTTLIAVLVSTVTWIIQHLPLTLRSHHQLIFPCISPKAHSPLVMFLTFLSLIITPSPKALFQTHHSNLYFHFHTLIPSNNSY